MFEMVQQRREQELRAAFRALGAVTPANARPAKEFPAVDAASFDNLLRAGVIREGAPGTFYLYESPRRARHFVRQLVFWIVVVTLPIGITQFCGQGQ